ncbi:probable G-protein coupled receptor 33 [Sceloporus undulatus]|uniref:probable G-protein coupled receptor 33 n=1 Tax=Sceloporus undulatus TaxID=8520 RepID=UPI001C4C338D|nr:probable G-protein coupled receptor 33 [Sceloporus undulatus]
MLAFLENTSTVYMNKSHAPVTIKPTNIIIAFLILMAFLVGTTVNGLFLWVLGLKMKRTVNTVWFLHLILSYLMSCSLMPFFAVYILHDFHWILGRAMCKIIKSFFSVVMFTTVFLLTIISLDRYLFTCHSIWSQHYRTIPRARKLIAGVWVTSLALSAPSLVFLETQEVDNKIQCDHTFAFSMDWDKGRFHLAFFLAVFLLAFLLPFLIILGCCCWIGHEMKKKSLVKTGKPFRVLVASVASFFICWLPYHLYHASLVFRVASERTVHILWDIAAAAGCFNICCTPIIYLFVGEKFQQVFKTSVLSLLNKGFMDYSIP